MHSEDLFQMYAEQYENLGRIHWAAGDKAAGRQYAKKSLDLLQEMGYGSYDENQLNVLLDSFEG
jgi:hypothetical protein